MQVLINGKVAGFFERSNPRNLPLPNIFGITPNEEVGSQALAMKPSRAKQPQVQALHGGCTAVAAGAGRHCLQTIVSKLCLIYKDLYRNVREGFRDSVSKHPSTGLAMPQSTHCAEHLSINLMRIVLSPQEVRR
jgi:hypothetical protein